MFEDQSQLDIEELIKTSPEFKQLYQHHKKLDKKVMDAELGVLPIDETTLGRMKREKLAAKDRLVRMVDRQP
ncbi:MAG: YdcH family protein [Pseudomonadota bacterium]|nr:YdcH family protein [Pseudomonadota bacterium]